MGCLGTVEDCGGEVCALESENPSVVKQRTHAYANAYAHTVLSLCSVVHAVCDSIALCLNLSNSSRGLSTLNRLASKQDT